MKVIIFRKTGNESKDLIREAISKIWEKIFSHKCTKAFCITLVDAHSCRIGYRYLANIRHPERGLYSLHFY
jgi:hypothetical protein